MHYFCNCKDITTLACFLMLQAMSHFTVPNNAQIFIISEFEAWILDFTSDTVTGHYERLTFHLMCPYKAISIKEHMKVSDYRQRSLCLQISHFLQGMLLIACHSVICLGPPGSDCSFFRLSSYIVSPLLPYQRHHCIWKSV